MARHHRSLGALDVNEAALARAPVSAGTLVAKLFGKGWFSQSVSVGVWWWAREFRRQTRPRGIWAMSHASRGKRSKRVAGGLRMHFLTPR